ncbi:GNAT family N-acetyltransferase [Algoriphagus formosus]|uniref:GNAT family N-acetyltransferase n=1 Tax=Algoriphagus formosus TaxID=2007308 RepID=UPI000C28DAC0|nr:GNAT family N-acetyltransferase [Algoriphagus formosus]
MNYLIEKCEPSVFPLLVEIWEDSVRKTHNFLSEEDIAYFKPLILNSYLHAVDLRVVRDSDSQILGFLGVAEENLEMLFLHSNAFGKGLGRLCLDYAINEMGVEKVDVNEQNEQALGFYLHCGFKIIGRSELDPQGKPFPILHLALKS